jgi:hypothetical protein
LRVGSIASAIGQKDNKPSFKSSHYFNIGLSKKQKLS